MNVLGSGIDSSADIQINLIPLLVLFAGQVKKIEIGEILSKLKLTKLLKKLPTFDEIGRNSSSFPFISGILKRTADTDYIKKSFRSFVYKALDSQSGDGEYDSWLKGRPSFS